MKKRNVRYAVVGCGDHAWRGHVEPAMGIGGLELVAVHDPDVRRAASFMRHSGGRAAVEEESHALLHRKDVDAVIICSPDRFHFAQLEAAVKHGKHVLVEKPVASSADDCRLLEGVLREAADKGLIVTSCHPRRFDDLYIEIRRRIPQWTEAYGPVMEMEFDFSYHEPSKTGLHTGLLMDHVNHEFDLMNFLLAPPHTVAYKLIDRQDRYHVAGASANPVEDHATFSFKGTRMLKSKRYPEFIRLRFARGELSVHCLNGQAFIQEHESGATQLLQLPHTDYPEKFGRLMTNFRDAVLGKAENYLAAHELLRNTKIGIALTEGWRWEG